MTTKLRLASLTFVCSLLAAPTLADKGGNAGPSGGPAIGAPAPDFELTDIDGKTHKLAELKDKIVVLEWWNQDCPACQAATPTMIETSRKLGEKGIVWIAVDSTHYQTADKNKAFRDSKSLPYPIAMDTDGKVGRAYGAKTTPHMFVINKGVLAYSGAIDNGAFGKPGDRVYVAEAVEELLAGKPVTLAETKPYGCSVKYKK